MEEKTIMEVVTCQQRNIKDCKWYNTFLVVTLKEKNKGIEFSESPAEIKYKLLQIFEEVVNVTQ
jgi:hypothetical protein